MTPTCTHRRRGPLAAWLRGLIGSLLVAFGPETAHAQPTTQPYGLEFGGRAAVMAGADTLANPWAGGLNMPTFGKMDFDRDGTPDLLVWDGRTQRPLTFVARAGRWHHAPAYEAAFPAPDSGATAYFGRLRDFNGDGLPDLFLGANQYVRLYRQELVSGGLGFRFVRVSAPYLQTAARPGAPLTRLQVAPWTTWDVADADADGDLDLLAYDLFSWRLLLYRNQATTGGAEPVFLRDSVWAGITWCGGRQLTYAFTADATLCRAAGPQHGSTPAATITATDATGDGLPDLLMGVEYVATLGLARNSGTPAQARFAGRDFTASFSGTGVVPLRMLHAPAVSVEDVTFDGQPDYLLSPWLVLPATSVEDLADLRRSAALYAAGTALLQDDFLQSGMLDVGENAAPTLGDLDGDGDLDLLVGNQGDYEPDPAGSPRPRSYRAHLRFYRNEGTPQRAVFRLAEADFGQFSQLDRRALVPVLVDLDGDGRLDLVLRSSTDDLGAVTPPLGYILNVAAAGQLASFPYANLLIFNFQIGNRGRTDLPCFTDVDRDGRVDMLLGTKQLRGSDTTALHYVRNQGGPPQTGFVLADANFGRLPSALRALTGLSPAIADLNADGQPELLTAADDGELRVWPQLLAQPAAPSAGLHHLVRNDLTTVFGPARLGRRPVLATGDLDGDGRSEVLVGMGGGGVRLLRSQSSGVLGRAPEVARAAPLHVFPNPATTTGGASSLTVEWAETSGAPPALLALLDMLGRPVRQTTATGGTARLPVSGLPTGVYTVRVQWPGRAALTRRVLLTE